MAENFQEQLDAKIKKEPHKVKALDISEAYSKTVESFRKSYEEKGGTDFEEDNKVFLEAAQKKLEEQLRHIAKLQADFREEKDDVVSRTIDAKRKERYKNAHGYIWNLTDPTRKGAEIDDYADSGNNAYNPPRELLAGYMTAVQMQRPLEVPAVWEKAKMKFKGSSWWPDSYVDTNDVADIAGREYLSAFDNKDVAYQTKGFLAGYLRFAWENLQTDQEKQAYKQYLLGEVDKTLKGITYPPLNGEDWEINHHKGSIQLNALSGVMSYSEWKEFGNQKIKRTYETFKNACDAVTSGGSGMVFKDAEVKAMLEKKPEELTFADYDKVLSASEKARGEIYAFMVQKKAELKKAVQDNREKFDALEDRSDDVHGSPISEEAWKNLEGSLQQQSSDLDAVGFVQESSIADLASMWTKMAQVESGNGIIAASLGGFEEKIKAAESREPEVQKFLEEKNLAENYDEGKDQYAYSIGGFELKVEGGKVLSNFKNPEAKQLFEAKAVQYLQGLVKDGKLDEDDQAKLQKIKTLIEEAKQASVFSFGHKPSKDELEQNYTSKFVPAWEKASKDFDAQFNLGGSTQGEGYLSKPSGTVGQGFLGRSAENKGAAATEAKDAAPSSANVRESYADHWANGTDVPLGKPETLGETFKNFTGGLMVSSRIKEVGFLDPDTHKRAMLVPGGTGARANEITLAEPNGSMRIVDNFHFVKVNYGGKIYDAPLEFLEKNPDSIRAEKEGKLRSAEKPAEGAIDLRFLQHVNFEYLPALVRMAQFGETASGIQFDVLYDKSSVPCTFAKRGPESYVLEFNGVAFSYKSLREAMLSVNDGIIVSTLTQRTIQNPQNYKPYENIIDEFKEEPKVAPNNEVYFELDWKNTGRGEGNAQVWLNVKKNGLIEYRLRRDFIGPQGESDRYGYAANFDDLMRQLAHFKIWSENYEDRESDKKLTATVIQREILFGQVTDPRKFYEPEAKIGRPFSFDVFSNEVVQMYLDWGSHDPKDRSSNAMLNCWVGPDGLIHYILNYAPKNLITEGTVENVDQLIARVATLKS